MRFALVSHTGELTRVSCEGEITQHELPVDRDPVEDLLGPVIFRGRALMDLGHTSYIDSSGISYLLRIHRQFQKAGGRLVFHSAPPSVMQVFKLLQMPSVLNIAADEAGAQRLAQEGAS